MISPIAPSLKPAEFANLILCTVSDSFHFSFPYSPGEYKALNPTNCLDEASVEIDKALEAGIFRCAIVEVLNEKEGFYFYGQWILRREQI